MKFNSFLISNARGKAGDVVFLGRRFGALIARQQFIPSDPQTSAQIDRRDAFTDLSANWNSMTDDQRIAWDDYSRTEREWEEQEFSHPARTGRATYFAERNLSTYLEKQGTVPSLDTSLDPPSFHPYSPIITGLEVVESGSFDDLRIIAENPNDAEVRPVVIRSNTLSTAVNRYYGPMNSGSWDTPNQGWDPFETRQRTIPNMVPSTSGAYFFRISWLVWPSNDEVSFQLGRPTTHRLVVS